MSGKSSKNAFLIVLLFSLMVAPDSGFADSGIADCGYQMCEYEKGNIDEIIIEHAGKSRTLMFGEIHDSVLEGTPPPLADSEYVVSLLPALKKIGYGWLALEVKKDAKENTHSKDILRFHEAYVNGRETDREKYVYAKPGWIDLIGKASDLGYRIRFIDVHEGSGNLSRDRGMFEKIRRDIFEKDATAKVVVYVGANHVLECETDEGRTFLGTKRRPLGLLLNTHTNGHNFSVYMGYAHDTPPGCDLFISHFIWNGKWRGREWSASFESRSSAFRAE